MGAAARVPIVAKVLLLLPLGRIAEAQTITAANVGDAIAACLAEAEDGDCPAAANTWGGALLPSWDTAQVTTTAAMFRAQAASLAISQAGILRR